MTNTTLLINEKEKENAKALTQSFAKTDIKSRAYINALGAEVCLKYLQDNDISSEPVYNMHNIRKILEEFDISDIMLSNIHIDVRVVRNQNQIFVPKSHFDFNITPDIYIVLQISKDYSQMEFLGFFEPKMLNKKNTNGDYYFIEKEKLSSPVDLKNFINNYQGSTSKDISKEEIENAKYLIISMTDHNVTEDDKKQLLNFLKNNAKLRNRFIEFENFEMLAYQAVNTLDIDLQNENNMPFEEMTSGELDDDTVEDIELSNALNEESEFLDNPLEDSEITNNQKNENPLGDMSGAAVLGAEIAGTALASAALSGATEGAEIAQETTQEVVNAAVDMAVEAAETTAEAVTDVLESENENKDHSEAPEEKESETNIAEAMENLQSTDNPNDTFNLSALDELNLEGSSESEQNFESQNTFSDLQNSLDTLFNDEDEPMHNTETIGMSSFDTLNSSNDMNTDSLVFSNNDDFDDLVFENDDEYDSYDSEISTTNSSANLNSAPLGKPAISPVEHIPISEATELVSLESIRLGELPPLETPKDQLETMEMSEFQNLVDNYVPIQINDESETVDFNAIPKNPTKTDYQENNETQMLSKEIQTENEMKISDEHMQNLPDEVEQSRAVDENELTSDDFMQDMPEEVVTDIKKDELSSDDFMQNLPDEVELPSAIDENELTSDDFMQDMPDEVELPSAINENELTSDDFMQDMPEEVVTDIKKDELTSDDFMQDMPKDVNITKSFPEAEQSMDLSEDIDFNSGLALGELSDINEEVAVSDDSETTVSKETNKQIDPEVTVIDGINSAPIFENPDDMNEQTDEVSAFDDIDEMNKAAGNRNNLNKASDIDNLNEDNAQIGVLYNGTNNNQLNNSELQDELPENYDFRPKRKGTNFIMPVFAIMAAVIIAGSVVGFLVKNKNSIDAETLVQSSTDEALSPETNNSDVLANNNSVEPAIPTEMEDVAPAPVATEPTVTKEAKQEIVKNAKEAIKQQQQQATAPAPKTPLNASKTVALKKMSWEVPDYLSYSDNIRKYLQTAGKSIKLTLSSDLLLTNEYIYSNQVKVNLKLTKDGNIQDAKIVASSGSGQVDKIVLQTVKDTLNVVKPPQGEVPTPNYNLGLIIYL